MDLTKEAIKHIQESAIQPGDRILFEDNAMWAVDNDGNVRQIEKKVEGLSQYPLSLHTLTGLVDYIKSNLERLNEKLYLHIESNESVTLKGLLEEDGQRELIVSSEALLPHIQFDYFHGAEDFLIILNSRFTDDYDRKELIAFAGNVKEENARQTSDDGFSQKTTVKRGIASAQEELVPNPVTLAPYRTFTEVAQPPSEFVFRMKDGPRFGIFEADGGAWKNQAIFNIKVFLENELKEEIDDKRITILA